MVFHIIATICILSVISFFCSFVTSLYILNSKNVNACSKGMNLLLAWVLPFYWSYRFFKDLLAKRKYKRGDIPFSEIINIFGLWD
ncbi:hypothetical protein MYP_2750 [Sporocytophaga myxococcoides]|uniref:Uncharacterized protein n=1 Tax=Sporocytophaga myxococcoides TaxID=153721 RepID=A0A098LEY6_9BACT|nr:hypothetical protein MYP_2750 [Sporocytophaga myxococcoides]